MLYRPFVKSSSLDSADESQVDLILPMMVKLLAYCSQKIDKLRGKLRTAK